MKYEIAAGDSQLSLTREVMKLIEMGFSPTGGVAVYKFKQDKWLYQAMVKKGQ